jgi:hypothetical protein
MDSQKVRMVLTLAVGAAAATEWFAFMDQCFHALLAGVNWAGRTIPEVLLRKSRWLRQEF